MLTGLADVIAAAGLTVHTVTGWESRNDGTMDDVRGVLAHHTAGPSTGNAPSLGVCVNGRPGLPGPLSHVLLARDGSVYVIAAGKCNHAGLGSGFGLPTNDANPHLIGIEAESDGSGDWTAEQLDAYPRLCRAFADHYGFPVNMVIGHLEWAPTRKIDPHGWPGGMDGLRAQTASVGANDMSAVGIVPTSYLHPQTVEAGKMAELATQDGGPSFMAGPVIVLGGTLAVDFTDLGPDSRWQARLVTVKPPAKAGQPWQLDEDFSLEELPGSTGQTFGTFVVPPLVLPDGHRLRLLHESVTGQTEAHIESLRGRFAVVKG